MSTTDDSYRPHAIEAKWQQRWAESCLYRTPDPHGKKTFYCLDFFPYPSGHGLSVGHGRNYVPTDVISRYRRMRGDAVLHPMGWDAFGLPAENVAIARNVHPREITRAFSANYRHQMTLIGCSYDWEREINSSHPDYYRWTQWFFLLLFRRGLAYRAVGKQWWCPGCRTVLANEQVESGGDCWRGHRGVHKRDLEQWYFRITAYAEELLQAMETLDWPEHILTMQRNWIGCSAGVEFRMPVVGQNSEFTVYTTRPDTIFGMTFAVLAPEHPLLDRIVAPEQRPTVTSYCQHADSRSEVDRLSAGRDGVFTGAFAINPVNGVQVPVYVADYVLMTYGGGAIMGVPAHDERDFGFALRHGISITVAVAPPDWDGKSLTAAYTDPGTMVNSDRWDGMPSDKAGEAIADWLESEGIGRRAIQYRMRDWLISRQRYWGAPIPIVYCDHCGTVPVPESDLPVLLPHVEAWLPGQEGRSPLANVPSFVKTTCPICSRAARRETDTLDGFACSSWYFLRFVSPRYSAGPFDPAALAAWGPPDLYVGGAEHAVMHLLYARFWTKVMADAGLIPFREPFPILRSQGVMHARDPETGEVRRMAKSAGNVVTPDSVAEAHGADALRVYLLFMAPFENNTTWDEGEIRGAERFLARAWRLVKAVGAEPPVSSAVPAKLTRRLHQTIRRVTSDVERIRFNTAVAALMTFLNELETQWQAGVTAELAEAVRSFVLLLAPFAPYIAEELWALLGGENSVHRQAWPVWDEALAAEATITMIVQVNGRVRDRLEVRADTSEDDIKDLALASPRVARYTDQRSVTRVIVVPGRAVNVVTH